MLTHKLHRIRQFGLASTPPRHVACNIEVVERQESTDNGCIMSTFKILQDQKREQILGKRKRKPNEDLDKQIALLQRIKMEDGIGIFKESQSNFAHHNNNFVQEEETAISEGFTDKNINKHS